MSLKRLKVVSLFVLLALGGCRREDWRTMTVEMPDLTSADEATVVRVLSKYEGVRMSSLFWDESAKMLTLSYDSMKIAQANVRYAIDEKGIRVKFPEKTDEHAGH